MRESQVIIERVRRVSAELQQLDLAVDAPLLQLRPGQSLFARPLDQDGWEPYLRELWIPVDIRPGVVTVEVPLAVRTLPNQIASVLSPIGRPIPLRPNLQHLLLIAENALPTPLVLLMRTLLGGGVQMTLVLGGSAARYPLELLSPEIEIVRAEDWSWPEQVEMLHWADQVLVLTAPHQQAEVYGRFYDMVTQLRHQVIPEDYIAGLYYGRLACGVGACMACQVPARKEPLLACSDGPAFDLSQVKF